MVTFKNEDKAVDEADVEAACPVDNGNGSLSKSSRAWDLDGDGELGKPSLLPFVVDIVSIRYSFDVGISLLVWELLGAIYFVHTYMIMICHNTQSLISTFSLLSLCTHHRRR